MRRSITVLSSKPVDSDSTKRAIPMPSPGSQAGAPPQTTLDREIGGSRLRAAFSEAT
jgi:hypothetical protein